MFKDLENMDVKLIKNGYVPVEKKIVKAVQYKARQSFFDVMQRQTTRNFDTNNTNRVETRKIVGSKRDFVIGRNISTAKKVPNDIASLQKNKGRKAGVDETPKSRDIRKNSDSVSG